MEIIKNKITLKKTYEVIADLNTFAISDLTEEEAEYSKDNLASSICGWVVKVLGEEATGAEGELLKIMRSTLDCEVLPNTEVVNEPNFTHLTFGWVSPTGKKIRFTYTGSTSSIQVLAPSYIATIE